MGARAPFLEIKPEVWAVLRQNGFLYDRWGPVPHVFFFTAEVAALGGALSAAAPGRGGHRGVAPRSCQPHPLCTARGAGADGMAPPLPARPPCRSSLIEEGAGASISTGPANRVWPWDMAQGIPTNCA